MTDLRMLVCICVCVDKFVELVSDEVHCKVKQ